MENLVLTCYEDVFQANLALDSLKINGVDAELKKNSNIYEQSKSLLSYLILVPISDLEKAIFLLDQLEME
jgi:hypothetical protein